MKRIQVSTSAPWEPVVGYARCVRVDDRVFVTGTVATGPGGARVGENDAYAQTVQALNNIERALTAAGCTLADVVRTRMFVTDIGRDWEAVGRAHGARFAERRPATSMVEVSGLIEPWMLVEIEADAIIGAGKLDIEQVELP